MSDATPSSTPRPRVTRRCALQAMYQFDAGNADDVEVVTSAVAALARAGGEWGRLPEPSPAEVEAGLQLATLAWEFRAEADAAIEPLAPEWPTHRQPVVDRSILRLAVYELRYSEEPPGAVLNEAVELAKVFGTEKSPAFINAVLDRLRRRDSGESLAKAIGDTPLGPSDDPADAARSNEDGADPGAASAPPTEPRVNGA